MLVVRVSSAETADWNRKKPSPLCNDPLYVLIHDVKCTVDAATAARHPECVQADGTAITMYFIKFDEFVNW